MTNLNYRNLVLGINSKIPLSNNSYVQAINFDNAATTPSLISVAQEVMRFLPWYSSVHRGFGYKSQASTKIYEESRNIVLRFVNANPETNTVIFVKNTTEALNKLSNMLYSQYKDDVILCTEMEHHSNDLPWRKYNIDYIRVDEYGRLLIEDLEDKLIKYNGRVKLVTITGASNVSGYKNNIHLAAKLAHKYNAKIVIDGAQLVPHSPVDMKDDYSDEHIDFLAFSAHKMYAPFGTGVLIGKKEDFEGIAPDYSGGGTVDIVTEDFVKWTNTPGKDEAGSPNIIGVVALSIAIETLSSLGMENIEKHEQELTSYALNELRNIPHIQLYYDAVAPHQRISIIPFNIEGMPHETVAKILSYEAGIAARNGCFCAHPYVQRLLRLTDEEIKDRINGNIPKLGLVRISFGLYNTTKEIDHLIYMLNKIASNRDYYMRKYSNIE